MDKYHPIIGLEVPFGNTSFNYIQDKYGESCLNKVFSVFLIR